MECREIVSNLKFEARGKIRFASFFVIDADPHDSFVAEILGECQVDPQSMLLFRSWIQGEVIECTLLVSVDYKYARVIQGSTEEYLKFIGFLHSDPRSLPMLPNTVFGPPREKLIPALRRELARRPAEQVRYGLKRSDHRKVLKRLCVPTDFLEFNPLFATFIDQARTAPDVNIVWRLICTESPEIKRPDLVEELEWRNTKGWHQSESWFIADGVTLESIKERRSRAMAHFENLISIIRQMNPGIVTDDFGAIKKTEEQLRIYLKSITDLDEMNELYVVSAYELGAPDIRNYDGADEPQLAEFSAIALDMLRDSRRGSCIQYPQAEPFVASWATLWPLLWERLSSVLSRELRKQTPDIHAPSGFGSADEVDF